MQNRWRSGAIDGKNTLSPSLSCPLVRNHLSVYLHAIEYFVFNLGDTQFQIISMLNYGVPMCVSAENGRAAKARPCAEKDSSQYFKWDLSRHLTNAKSGLCLTGSATRWGKVWES